MQFCGKAEECLAALTNSASVAPAPRRSQRGSAVLRETNSAKLQSYMADALAQRPTPTMAYAPTQQQQRVRLSMK